MRRKGPVRMDKARIYIDLNEMVTEDIVLLSRDDAKVDSRGELVTFYEGMPVSVYSDDASDAGEWDPLLGEGVALRYDLRAYPQWKHVRWCLRLNWKSLVHASELKGFRSDPKEKEDRLQ